MTELNMDNIFEPDTGGNQEGIHPHTMKRAQSEIAKLLGKIYSQHDEGALILIQAKGIGFVVEEASESPEEPSLTWIRHSLIRVLTEEALK